MSHLEPTYLRYIYDGLIKGSIHPENSADLPDGLIGLYEEAFDERTSVTERQKLLQRFAIWALLKKEVSAAFVAEVLGQPEDEIQNFISTYSAWFNSPESGKYQLYHERLKLFLLQKMSEEEIHELLEKFISRLEHAIKEQKADEFEWYGLEFMAGHLSVAAMLNGDGEKLVYLSYSKVHWKRQIKMSKGYSWTKNGLKLVMKWASKFNDDEVVECGLQTVTLLNEEQNSVWEIVELVAQGEIDLALMRISDFEGNDKEDLQRKFILYMLCLWELTFGETKNESFKKEGICKVIKHLDEQMPNELTMLNWSEFFSSYIMFQMAIVWNELNLDFRAITKRTHGFDFRCIVNQKNFNKEQFDLLFEFCEQTEDLLAFLVNFSINNHDFNTALLFLEDVKTTKLRYKLNSRLSKLIMNNDAERDKFMSKAIEEVTEINDQREKSIGFSELATENYLQGTLQKSEELLNQSISIARTIDDLQNKCLVLSLISLELIKQQRLEKAKEIFIEGIEESLELQKWSNEVKNVFSNFVSIEIKLTGDYSLTLKAASSIHDSQSKIQALLSISKALFLNNNISESDLILKEAISITDKFENYYQRDLVLSSVSIEIASQGQLKKALEVKSKITDFVYQKMAIRGIISELLENNKIEESVAFLDEFSDKLDDPIIFRKRMSEICLMKNDTKGMFNVLFKCLSQPVNYKSKQFSLDHSKSRLLVQLSSDFAKQGQFKFARFIIDLIDVEYEKGRAIQALSVHLARNEKFDDSVEVVMKLNSDRNKKKLVSSIIEIFKVFYNRLEFEPLFKNLLLKIGTQYRDEFLKKIANEVIENGIIGEAELVLNEMESNQKHDFDSEIAVLKILEFEKNDRDFDAIQFINEKYHSYAKIRISLLLCAKCISTDKFDAAYKILRNILNEDFIKKEELHFILNLTGAFSEKNKKEYVFKIIYAVKSKFDKIDDYKTKNEMIILICNQLLNLKQTDEALRELNNLTELNGNVNEFIVIVERLVQQNENQKALELTNKILDLLSLEKTEALNDNENGHVKANFLMNQINLLAILDKLGNSQLRAKILDVVLIWLRNESQFEINYNDIIKRLFQSILISGRNNEIELIIDDESIYKPSDLIEVCAFHGNYKLAEMISGKLKISQVKRNECWMTIGSSFFETNGFEKSYILTDQFESVEIRKSLKIGIIKQLHGSSFKNNYLIALDRVCVTRVFLSIILKDRHIGTKNYNYILQLYALNQIFFEDIPEEKIQRFNRTLNIQWAIDIKNQLPN
jgi:hypothetical protein